MEEGPIRYGRKAPPKGMDCPVCAVPLTMSERQNIEIDYCPQCRGVWLDRGELDKIIERSVEQTEQQTQQARSGKDDDRKYRDDDRYREKYYKEKYRRKSWLQELFD